MYAGMPPLSNTRESAGRRSAARNSALFWVRSNYALERSGSLSSPVRVRLIYLSLPSARLKRLRPAAQRED